MTIATEHDQAIAEALAPTGLTAKLVQAALDVENVQKAGVNKAQGYDYVRAEDVVAAATKALLARGVLTEFECLHADVLPVTSKSGGSGLIVTATCRLIVTDAAAGDFITLKAMGSGSDYPGDKAIYKAMTGARKYAFLHLLAIPIGDDPDAHRAELHEGTTRKPKLPAERVEAITTKFGERKMKVKDIELMLGAANIDGLRAKSPKAIKERLESLSDDQAGALEGLLNEA